MKMHYSYISYNSLDVPRNNQHFNISTATAIQYICIA